MTSGKWLVPSVINPIETVCVQFQVPNDERHIAAFWGAINELALAWNWQDSYLLGSQTAYVWRDVIESAVLAVKDGENCDMPIDCNEVEQCLATSAIIAQINNLISQNTSDISDNQVAITTNANNISDIGY